VPEEPPLLRVGIHARSGALRIRDARELEEQRDVVAVLLVQQQQAARDLLACGAVVVPVADAEVGAHDLEDGEEGDVPAVGDGVALEHREAAGAAALQELEAQPALAGARLGHHAHRLPVALAGARQGGLQHLHVVGAAHEATETAGPRHVEAGAVRAQPLELEDADLPGHALDRERAQVLQREVARNRGGEVGAQVDRVRRGQLLHASGEARGVPLRRVIHAEVVADLAHHHLAGVAAHAHGEAEPGFALDFAAVPGDLVAELKRRIAGALGVVLVGDGGAEERHDPVARVLIDGALEAMDAVGEDCEEAIHDLVPGLGIQVLAQLHGARHVREEHRHLLPLSHECGARGQDLLGEVAGRVVARAALGSGRPGAGAAGGAAAVAELRGGRERRAALGAGRAERGPALLAEARTRGILVFASGATHLRLPSPIASWSRQLSVSGRRDRSGIGSSRPVPAPRLDLPSVVGISSLPTSEEFPP
jgi:hypothetical protein